MTEPSSDLPPELRESVAAIAKGQDSAPSDMGRTDRTPDQDSHSQAENGVRSDTEHEGEHSPNTPPSLAYEPRILDRLDEAVAAQGLIGEQHIARATKLVATSRLLDEPGRQVVKGDSSTGKSFAVDCALNTCAPEGLFIRTSTSALALFYTDEGALRHKALVFYEANQLGDDDDPLARVLRTLISEDKLIHEVTDPKTRTTQLLQQEGPVAFISTTCKPSLDREIETRILSLHSDAGDEQTQKVVASILAAAAEPRGAPDLAEWHQLDRWLEHGEREVVLPWAAALATFNLTGPPRLRRDIDNLLSLSRAHALLHRATRELDERGRIVSTLDDYETVRVVLSEAMAVATDKAVRKGTREVVEAVQTLRDDGEDKITLRAAQRAAGRSPSTTHTDVHDALDRGYLVNLSPTENRFNLAVGDPLPAEAELLPSREEMAEVFGQRSPGVRSGTEHPEPASQSGLSESVRGVRPVSSDATQNGRPGLFTEGAS